MALIALAGFGITCFGMGLIMQSQIPPIPSYKVPWLQLGTVVTGVLLTLVGMVVG